MAHCGSCFPTCTRGWSSVAAGRTPCCVVSGHWSTCERLQSVTWHQRRRWKGWRSYRSCFCFDRLSRIVAVENSNSIALAYTRSFPLRRDPCPGRFGQVWVGPSGIIACAAEMAGTTRKAWNFANNVNCINYHSGCSPAGRSLTRDTLPILSSFRLGPEQQHGTCTLL